MATVPQPSVLSTGWRPPPLRSINPTDCAPLNAWIGAIAQAGLQFGDSSRGPESSIPYDLVLPAMRALVPSNWTDTPTDTDLMAWNVEVWTNDTVTDSEKLLAIQRMADVPLNAECLPDLCPHLRWEGDPDVSGLGMMISYYTEAFLATTFSFIFVLARVGPVARFGKRFTSSLPPKLHARLVHSAFIQSAETFLYALLLFSISMHLATIFRLGSLIQHPLEPAPLYGLQGSVFMSAFSIMPALLVQSTVENRFLGKNFFRMTLWLLLIVLAVTVPSMVAPNSRRLQNMARLIREYSAPEAQAAVDPDAWRFFTANMQDMLWALACVDAGGLGSALEDLYFVTLALLALNAVWWICYTVSHFHRRGRGSPCAARTRVERWLAWKPRRWESYLRMLNALAAVVLMWATLALFHRYRNDIASKAGESDEDERWSFGQILSLATWASVILDLVRIIKGEFQLYQADVSHINRFPDGSGSSAEVEDSLLKKPEAIANESNAPARHGLGTTEAAQSAKLGQDDPERAVGR